MTGLREAMGELPDAIFADLLESEDASLLVIDLPGSTAETVDVRVEGRTLVIEARRTKTVPEGFEYVSEGRSMFLDLELPLPPDVTAEGAEATVDRGVIEVSLPKSSTTTGESIPVEDA